MTLQYGDVQSGHVFREAQRLKDAEDRDNEMDEAENRQAGVDTSASDDTAESEVAATVLTSRVRPHRMWRPKRHAPNAMGDRYISGYFSIRWKVGGSFAILLLMSVVIALVAFLQLTRLQHQVNVLANQNMQVVEQSSTLDEELLNLQSSMRGYLITGNQTILDSTYTVEKAQYPKTFQVLQQLLANDKTAQQTLSTTRQGFDAYVKYADQLISERGYGQGTQAMDAEAAGQGDAPAQTAMTGLQTLIQTYQNQSSKSATSLQQTVDVTLLWMAILCAIAIVIGLVAGIPATLSTPRNLNRVTRMLRDIASAGGDLTKRIEGVRSRDEVARLAMATNALLESIAALVLDIGRQSETLAASAEELTASTDETSRAVGEIASTASEFAHVSERAVMALTALNGSLVSVSRHGEETASRAGDVATAVANVSQSTERGQEMVEHAKESMQTMQTMTQRANQSVRDLAGASREIGAILATIRTIAEETNLLALNASIEAARAGDAGRGFAVVAAEVRLLAEQSRAATADIDAIIVRNMELMAQVGQAMEDGVAAVDDGQQAFLRTQSAFAEIRSAVEQVVPTTADIVERAMTQQTLVESGRQDIVTLNELMEQVAAGSENNAASSQETLATVEEIAASSHELAQIASALQDGVGRFQV